MGLLAPPPAPPAAAPSRLDQQGQAHRARRRLAPVEVVRARGGEERDDVLGERLRDSVEDRHVGALGDVRDGRIFDGRLTRIEDTITVGIIPDRARDWERGRIRFVAEVGVEIGGTLKNVSASNASRSASYTLVTPNVTSPIDTE